MGIKNTVFSAEFESAEKVAKTFMQKKLSVKKERKFSSLNLLLCAKVFGP
jgi:hypothetical protein